MVELFLYEDADAVFGSRFMPGGYKRALFFRHELGNKFLTFLCDMMCDLNLTDMETCYKMVRADLLKSIPLKSSTFDSSLNWRSNWPNEGAGFLKSQSGIQVGLTPKARKSNGRTACVSVGPFSAIRFPTSFTKPMRTAGKLSFV